MNIKPIDNIVDAVYVFQALCMNATAWPLRVVINITDPLLQQELADDMSNTYKVTWYARYCLIEQRN